MTTFEFDKDDKEQSKSDSSAKNGSPKADISGSVDERVAAHRKDVLDRAADRFRVSVQKIYPGYNGKK
jgi:hypothetical protein